MTGLSPSQALFPTLCPEQTSSSPQGSTHQEFLLSFTQEIAVIATSWGLRAHHREPVPSLIHKNQNRPHAPQAHLMEEGLGRIRKKRL